MEHRTPEETYGPALDKAVGDLQSLDYPPAGGLAQRHQAYQLDRGQRSD